MTSFFLFSGITISVHRRIIWCFATFYRDRKKKRDSQLWTLYELVNAMQFDRRFLQNVQYPLFNYMVFFFSGSTKKSHDMSEGWNRIRTVQPTLYLIVWAIKSIVHLQIKWLFVDGWQIKVHNSIMASITFKRFFSFFFCWFPLPLPFCGSFSYLFIYLLNSFFCDNRCVAFWIACVSQYLDTGRKKSLSLSLLWINKREIIIKRQTNAEWERAKFFFCFSFVCEIKRRNNNHLFKLHMTYNFVLHGITFELAGRLCKRCVPFYQPIVYAFFFCVEIFHKVMDIYAISLIKPPPDMKMSNDIKQTIELFY